MAEENEHAHKLLYTPCPTAVPATLDAELDSLYEQSCADLVQRDRALWVVLRVKVDGLVRKRQRIREDVHATRRRWGFCEASKLSSANNSQFNIIYGKRTEAGEENVGKKEMTQHTLLCLLRSIDLFGRKS